MKQHSVNGTNETGKSSDYTQTKDAYEGQREFEVYRDSISPEKKSENTDHKD